MRGQRFWLTLYSGAAGLKAGVGMMVLLEVESCSSALDVQFSASIACKRRRHTCLAVINLKEDLESLSQSVLLVCGG